MDKIYLVTGTSADKGAPRTRCWGWYPTFDEAEKAAMANITDMYEAGWHPLIVIESCGPGVLSMLTEEAWYVYDKLTDTYQRTTKPEELEGIVHFGMQ